MGTLHDRVAAKLGEFGGYLVCTVCGKTQDLGDIAIKLTHGWPTHCGYTMRWITQSQLEVGNDASTDD